MSMFVANLLLALLWALLFGPFTPGNFLIGMAIGFVVLRLGTLGSGKPSYFRRVFSIAEFIGYFLIQVVVANLKMAMYTLGPTGRLRPGILTLPLSEGMSDFEITTLANVITLTPGTLSMDVSRDRSRLYVHFIHIEDQEREIRGIKEGFERRLLAATR